MGAADFSKLAACRRGTYLMDCTQEVLQKEKKRYRASTRIHQSRTELQAEHARLTSLLPLQGLANCHCNQSITQSLLEILKGSSELSKTDTGGGVWVVDS